MTIPDLPQPPWDPGLQNERTRLAWQRTILSGLACSLLVARLLAPDALLVAVLIGLVAIFSSALLGLVSTRRYADNHLALYKSQGVADARAQIAVSALVVLTALGALGYVVAV